MTSGRKSSGNAEPGADARPHGRIHLPSLSIQGFRGIKDLSVPRLGRVTLLAGRNAVVKTTVLDAVRIHASRARPAVLFELLVSREEITIGTGEDGDRCPCSMGGSSFMGGTRRETPASRLARWTVRTGSGSRSLS